jgi:hypothetical protein
MFNAIIKFFESIGRSRAAAEFIRLGRHDLARNIMMRN